MGNEQSSPTTHTSTLTISGFRIIRNTSTTTPLDTLHPYFDFIVGINGRQIDSPFPHLFTQELTNIALYGTRTGNAYVTLGIWCAKGARLRDVVIPLELQDKIDISKGIKSLGLTLQWSPVAISQEVWHVLEVIPNSPADIAGMVPYGDWILGVIPPDAGVHGGIYLSGEAALGDLIEEYINRPLNLYVYNHEYDVVREITITPNRTWGGEGALGCVLGYGALHRLPAPLTEPMAAPGETLFEATSAEDHQNQSQKLPTLPYSYQSAPVYTDIPTSQQQKQRIPTPTSYSPQYIIPAAQYGPTGRYSPAAPPPKATSGTNIPPSPGTTSPPPPLTQAHPRSHPHRPHKPVRKTHISMDEYMREFEQKSREEDHVPAKSGSKPGTPVQVPPPPIRPPPPRRGESNITTTS